MNQKTSAMKMGLKITLKNRLVLEEERTSWERKILNLERCLWSMREQRDCSYGFRGAAGPHPSCVYFSLSRN